MNEQRLREKAEFIVRSAQDAGVHVHIRRAADGEMIVYVDAPHERNPRKRRAAEDSFRAVILENMALLQRFGFAPKNKPAEGLA
jgi:hypothetical protein